MYFFSRSNNCKGISETKIFNIASERCEECLKYVPSSNHEVIKRRFRRTLSPNTQTKLLKNLKQNLKRNKATVSFKSYIFDKRDIVYYVNMCYLK